jgi:hypothetical protein
MDKCLVPTIALRFLERDKLMEPPNEPHYVERQRCLQQMFWNLAGTVSEWRDVSVVQEDCFLQSPMFGNAADEIARLRAEVERLGRALNGEAT